MILPLSYYQSSDVVTLAQDLIGKVLTTNFNNQRTAGIIVETEAYKGPDDKACHAYNNKRTPRTEVMFHKGGISYVYLIYGIHHLFNVVTGKQDEPHAVLIRAIQPLQGLEIMLHRRNMTKPIRRLTGGPGVLSKALGIDKQANQLDLTQSLLCIEDQGALLQHSEIIASPRVGVDYAGEDAKFPWRFRVKDSPWTSPAK